MAVAHGLTVRDFQRGVSDFMTSAGQKHRNMPDESMTLEERIGRARLLVEELAETIRDGLGLDIDTPGLSLQGHEDVALYEERKQNNEKLADGLADLCYVAFGTAAAAGIDLAPVLAEVHRSNMSKFIDGRLDSAGKFIKGPNYSLANLFDVLCNQIPLNAS